jgi:RNA polymerase sigma factor (sigma-70 family)
MAIVEELAVGGVDDFDHAFVDIVSDHQRAIYSGARRLTRQNQDAEDLAADTFLRAYAALRHYSIERRESLNMRPWLITILLNQWRNLCRSESRRPFTTAMSPEHEPTDVAPGPAVSAEQSDPNGPLAAALDQLPERQRIAVILRHVVGMSMEEVAEAMRCPPGTAKSHVSRGLQQLRALSSEVSHD